MGVEMLAGQRARSAVSVAIRSGKLQSASGFPCVDCGQPTWEYDHYLGYAEEHRLDIEPVCVPCHKKRHPRSAPTARSAILQDKKHTLWDWIAIRNLTVEALAQKTGLHRNTISNWQKGRSRPRYDLLLVVARALDVPMDAITLGIKREDVEV